jgi:hypothetical protein
MPSGWQADNAQRGIRHAGFKVADTDAWTPDPKRLGFRALVASDGRRLR